MLHSALLVMNAYKDGFNNIYGDPPGYLDAFDRRDWLRGQSDAIRQQSALNGPRMAASTIAVLGGLAAWVLICCDLLGLVLFLMAAGLIGWFLIKKGGKWLTYGLLAIGLLAVLYGFGSWVRRGMERRALQAEWQQRKEENARQIIVMHRADSILRVNRAKYSYRTKQRSQDKGTRPHRSSKLTLAEALGME